MTVKVGDTGVLVPYGGSYVFIPAVRPKVGDTCVLFPIEGGGYFAIPLATVQAGTTVPIVPTESGYVAVATGYVFIDLHLFKAVAAWNGITTSITYGDNAGNWGHPTNVGSPRMQVVEPRTDYFQLTYEDGGGGTFDIYFEIERLSTTTMRITGHVIGVPIWNHRIYYRDVEVGYLNYVQNITSFSVEVAI